jgi:RNA polymerase sigma-70 factor (ECF subfamily)
VGEDTPKVSAADQAMSRYSRGDAGAFVIVYDVVAPRLDSYLRRHLRERARIEDIIQQTFLQMHMARGTFIQGAPVLPWAFAISRRLMIDFTRRQRLVGESMDVSDDQAPGAMAWATPIANGEETLTAHETEARLSNAYRRLSAPQRAAYDLVATEGLTHAEAASVLGTTVTGIKLRVHRVYLALRAALSDGPQPPNLSPARGPR